MPRKISRKSSKKTSRKTSRKSSRKSSRKTSRKMNGGALLSGKDAWEKLYTGYRTIGSYIIYNYENALSPTVKEVETFKNTYINNKVTLALKGPNHGYIYFPLTIDNFTKTNNFKIFENGSITVLHYYRYKTKEEYDIYCNKNPDKCLGYRPGSAPARTTPSTPRLGVDGVRVNLQSRQPVQPRPATTGGKYRK